LKRVFFLLFLEDDLKLHRSGSLGRTTDEKVDRDQAGLLKFCEIDRKEVEHWGNGFISDLDVAGRVTAGRTDRGEERKREGSK